MSVYVDDMYRYQMGRHRGMKMSHMIADTREELFAMADYIGVDRKWLQHAGAADEHFDIAMSKRTEAVAAGAIEITMKDLVRKCRARRAPSPHTDTGGE